MLYPSLFHIFANFCACIRGYRHFLSVWGTFWLAIRPVYVSCVQEYVKLCLSAVLGKFSASRTRFAWLIEEMWFTFFRVSPFYGLFASFVCVFSALCTRAPWERPRVPCGGASPPSLPPVRVRSLFFLERFMILSQVISTWCPLRAFSVVYRATGGYAPLAYNYSLATGFDGLFCSLTKSPFCAIALCWLPTPVVV